MASTLRNDTSRAVFLSRLAGAKFVLLGREPEPTTRPDRERPR